MSSAIQEKVQGRLTRVLFTAILVPFVFYFGFAFFSLVETKSEAHELED